MNLHEQLDDAFETLSPPPAPIQHIMKRGTRMRWRKRTTVVVCAAAVATAAVVVPLTVRGQASAQPTSTHYTVTVQPPGPHSPADEISDGTINGKSWQIILEEPASTPPYGGQSCFWSFGPALRVYNNGLLPPGCPPPTGPTAADPVASNFSQDKGYSASFALSYDADVAANVTYVTVKLTNGTVLTLRPVSLYGSRYVAFAAPLGTLVEAVAYSSRGEIASALAPALGGGDVFGAWLRPGQHGIPQATGLVASGTLHGRTWSATVYLGPWGIAARTSEGSSGLQPASAPLGLSDLIVGVLDTPDPTGIAVWTVPSSTVRVVVTVHGEKAFQVRPVKVGVQRFVAFLVPNGFSLPYGFSVPSLTAYDSAGHVIASSRSPLFGPSS